MNGTTPNELTEALDRAYRGLVELDIRLTIAGVRAWQSPREHVIESFAGLQRARDAMRELASKPRAGQTVAAAPQAPCPKTPGPSERPQDTSDDDRGASILNRPHKGTTTATAQPQQPRETEASPDPCRKPEAHRDAYATPQGHDCIDSRLDV